MKKVLKAVSGLLILASMALFIGAGSNSTVALRAGSQQTTFTTTAANSQVDTLLLPREATLSGLSFAIHAKDSISITNVIVRRICDGIVLAPVAGDTIIGALTSVTNDTLKLATVTLTPYCDSYQFRITYAGSGCGVTTPGVTYVFNRQYYSK